jgi:hypothetical protein
MLRSPYAIVAGTGGTKSVGLQFCFKVEAKLTLQKHCGFLRFFFK